jgi:hypothetical protein
MARTTKQEDRPPDTSACPTCQGSGQVSFAADHHEIVTIPADGRADAWPCPDCSMKSWALGQRPLNSIDVTVTTVTRW